MCESAIHRRRCCCTLISAKPRCLNKQRPLSGSQHTGKPRRHASIGARPNKRAPQRTNSKRCSPASDGRRPLARPGGAVPPRRRSAAPGCRRRRPGAYDDAGAGDHLWFAVPKSRISRSKKRTKAHGRLQRHGNSSRAAAARRQGRRTARAPHRRDPDLDATVAARARRRNRNGRLKRYREKGGRARPARTSASATRALSATFILPRGTALFRTFLETRVLAVASREMSCDCSVASRCGGGLDDTLRALGRGDGSSTSRRRRTRSGPRAARAARRRPRRLGRRRAVAGGRAAQASLRRARSAPAAVSVASGGHRSPGGGRGHGDAAGGSPSKAPRV